MTKYETKIMNENSSKLKTFQFRRHHQKIEMQMIDWERASVSEICVQDVPRATPVLYRPELGNFNQ